MISLEQHNLLDNFVTAYIVGIAELEAEKVRGVPSVKMQARTTESWKPITDYLNELTTGNQEFYLTVEQKNTLQRLISEHVETAAKVERLKEQKVVAEEEGAGKDLKEKISMKLDKAIEERNIAFRQYDEVLKSLLARE